MKTSQINLIFHDAFLRFYNCRFTQVDEETVEYSLDFTPIKEVEIEFTEQLVTTTVFVQYDGEEVSCNYQAGGKVRSDGVNIQVYNLDVDEGPIEAATVEEDDPVTLVINANIYPEPEVDDVTWNIKDGDNLITLNAGQSLGKYKANTFTVKRDNKEVNVNSLS